MIVLITVLIILLMIVLICHQLVLSSTKVPFIRVAAADQGVNSALIATATIARGLVLRVSGVEQPNKHHYFRHLLLLTGPGPPFIINIMNNILLKHLSHIIYVVAVLMKSSFCFAAVPPPRGAPCFARNPN